jgi:hypothetical protein
VGQPAGHQLLIFEETGGGLAAVAHDRSLELFYDRYEVIVRFVAVLNEDPPPPRRVLYLHGLGGNGKSLLLRYLAAPCCVRLPPGEWERVRRLPIAELPAALSGVAKAERVPVARIDFGARPVGEKARHERVVLLFDTHEAFFGEAIADPQALLHADLVRPACPQGSSRSGTTQAVGPGRASIETALTSHAPSMRSRRGGSTLRGAWNLRMGMATVAIRSDRRRCDQCPA